MKTMSETDPVRIDKWLWAARFFKTRGLATEAIKGGKITLNGGRAKPSRTIQPGDRLQIRRGPYEFDIHVEKLSRQRGPATVAQTLYRETAASMEKREDIARQLRLDAASRPRSPGRPSKRDRRQIIRFTHGEDN